MRTAGSSICECANFECHVPLSTADLQVSCASSCRVTMAVPLPAPSPVPVKCSFCHLQGVQAVPGGHSIVSSAVNRRCRPCCSSPCCCCCCCCCQPSPHHHSCCATDPPLEPTALPPCPATHPPAVPCHRIHVSGSSREGQRRGGQEEG